MQIINLAFVLRDKKDMTTMIELARLNRSRQLESVCLFQGVSSGLPQEQRRLLSRIVPRSPDHAAGLCFSSMSRFRPKSRPFAEVGAEFVAAGSVPPGAAAPMARSTDGSSLESTDPRRKKIYPDPQDSSEEFPGLRFSPERRQLCWTKSPISRRNDGTQPQAPRAGAITPRRHPRPIPFRNCKFFARLKAQGVPGRHPVASPKARGSGHGSLKRSHRSADFSRADPLPAQDSDKHSPTWLRRASSRISV